jgi:hypothetical protein
VFVGQLCGASAISGDRVELTPTAGHQPELHQQVGLTFRLELRGVGDRGNQMGKVTLKMGR